ncbi:NERD domain-containing protein [Streptomyces sp. NBC_01483]|uniref:NERD domain-containing protein n=1 Tax=Streptomyces sp. NBC_01483 TaxID=2903883 RepID=UPI002E3091BB|nr:NERD domain-containing protein [Streptomyces sp. NBC_01483]
MKRSGNAAGRSPVEWAARERRKARKGVRRRVTAWVGLNPAAKRADALTVRAAHGAAAEKATGAQLRVLESRGWFVLHGRQVPGFRADLDHVLVPPTGTAVVVLDTKGWHAGWETTLRGGRVHCDLEDRHEQIEAVARYAARVDRVLGMPGVAVWPLLVVHGSRIRGGHLAAPVASGGVVHVLSVERLVPELVKAARGMDPVAAGVLARRVTAVLPPHRQ